MNRCPCKFCELPFGALVKKSSELRVIFLFDVQNIRTFTVYFAGAVKQLRSQGETTVEVDPCGDAEGRYFMSCVMRKPAFAFAKKQRHRSTVR